MAALNGIAAAIPVAVVEFTATAVNGRCRLEGYRDVGVLIENELGGCRAVEEETAVGSIPGVFQTHNQAAIMVIVVHARYNMPIGKHEARIDGDG